MKLADSWIDDEQSVAPIEAFHDEVDESEDGCGGVGWQQYVLKKPGTSNKQLHELARDIRGEETSRGKKLAVTQYKAIFLRWKASSRPFLRLRHDYFPEFLAKLDCVTVPKGETLRTAFERAKLRKPPSKVLLVENVGLRLFASSMPRASGNGRRPADHATSRERRKIVWAFALAHDRQLDQGTDNTGNPKAG